MKINPDTITGRIYLTIFALLVKNQEGIAWTQLNKMVQEAHPKFHPKTINGCVWKLVERFPDKVYKPEKGLFRLIST